MHLQILGIRMWVSLGAVIQITIVTFFVDLLQLKYLNLQISLSHQKALDFSSAYFFFHIIYHHLTSYI